MLHLWKNKNYIFLFFLLIIITLLIFVLFFPGLLSDLTKDTYHKMDWFNFQKYECNIDNDCIMSYTDKKDFQICVNKEYYNAAPQKKYLCLPDESLSCLCKSNQCIRSDNKIGCN